MTRGLRASRVRLLGAVVLLTFLACSNPPSPRRPYRRPEPEHLRLARTGVTDTVLLRRWRVIDSLADTETGDSLIQLYVGASRAGPSDGERWMNAIYCETYRMIMRTGSLAGGMAVQRVTDSLFADSAFNATFDATTQRWPSGLVTSKGCDDSDIQPAPDSLDRGPHGAAVKAGKGAR